MYIQTKPYMKLRIHIPKLVSQMRRTHYHKWILLKFFKTKNKFTKLILNLILLPKVDLSICILISVLGVGFFLCQQTCKMRQTKRIKILLKLAPMLIVLKKKVKCKKQQHTFNVFLLIHYTLTPKTAKISFQEHVD